MPMRTLVELLHIVAGLAATAVIVELSAWSYPLGEQVIWAVGAVAAVIVAAMGVGQMRRAWSADREQRARRHG